MKTGLLAISPFALATFCAVASAPAVVAGQPIKKIIVEIFYSAPNVCKVNVGNERFDLPSDGDRLLKFMRKLRPASPSLSFAMAPEVPYRCAGGAIFIAQRAGYTTFGVLPTVP